MTKLSERDINYVAYKMIHRWADDAKSSGGNSEDEDAIIFHDAGKYEAEEVVTNLDDPDWEDNRQAIIRKLDSILSDLEEEAAKND